MYSVEYINPFIAATVQALEVMAGMKPERGKPFVKTDHVAAGDISGVIGLAGEAVGSVAVTFPENLALKVYEAMVGEEARGLNDDVRDAVGEIANMIAGGAKAALTKEGYQFRIAIPTIVVGKNHTIEHKGQGPCLVVPFEMDGETFWVEVSFLPGREA